MSLSALGAEPIERSVRGETQESGRRVMDLAFVDLPPREAALVLPWPDPCAPGGLVVFETADAWRAAVAALSLSSAIPDVVRLKYARAQKLYLLGWIDIDLIKAGELVALTALELAVMDRYGRAFPKKQRSLAALLKHMVDGDGLTDTAIPMVVRCRGTAMGQLTGETKPSLAERRNRAAHGDPFDGMPVGGLVELVRDLITYAYRDMIAEAAERPR